MLNLLLLVKKINKKSSTLVFNPQSEELCQFVEKNIRLF